MKLCNMALSYGRIAGLMRQYANMQVYEELFNKSKNDPNKLEEARIYAEKLLASIYLYRKDVPESLRKHEEYLVSESELEEMCNSCNSFLSKNKVGLN